MGVNPEVIGESSRGAFLMISLSLLFGVILIFYRLFLTRALDFFMCKINDLLKVSVIFETLLLLSGF